MDERDEITQDPEKIDNKILPTDKENQVQPKSEEDEDLIVTGTDTDISPEELSMLERMDGFEATPDNQNLANAALDDVDNDGEALNQDSFGEDLSGDDLDVETGDEEDLLDLDDQELEE